MQLEVAQCCVHIQIELVGCQMQPLCLLRSCLLVVTERCLVWCLNIYRQLLFNAVTHIGQGTMYGASHSTRPFKTTTHWNQLEMCAMCAATGAVLFQSSAGQQD